VLMSSLAMFALGFWDDLKPLGQSEKLVGQILIAVAVCAFGLEFSGSRFHLPQPSSNCTAGES